MPYKIHLKEAKPYKGLMELDDQPHSVLDQPQPSTSRADPQQTEEPVAPDSEHGSSSSGATNICAPSGSESHSESEPEPLSSGSDDYEPPGQTNTAYLTSTTFSSDRHKWLCAFLKYLALPDAGYRKEAQRLQHTSQIKLLLEALAPKEDDLECLGADNGDAVWVRWVDPHLRKGTKAPGTLTSYLTSLQMFLTGQKYNPQAMPPLSPNLKVTFSQLILALKGWRACVESYSQDSQLRKYIAECDSLITNDDVSNLRKSKPYLEGASLIQKAEAGTKLSLRQFTLARDYLLCRLTLVTGTRPGALNNVLVTDYETSRVSKGNRIILVPKHKRTKDGPAMIGMDEQMQAEMATYVQKIRPAFANPGEDKPFVKDDGSAFPEGTIGKRVVAFFEKSGVTSTHVVHTHIRKFISTQTHQLADADEGKQVEKLMSHGSTTKQRCYVRSDFTTSASKAMNVVARVTGSQTKSTDPSQTAASTSEQQHPASLEVPLVGPSSADIPLSDTHKLAISQAFAEELAKNVTLSRNQVYDRMKTDDTLRTLTSNRSVSNFISYQQRRNPDPSPRPLSSTFSATSRVGRWVSNLDETTSTTTLREVWSATDTETITRRLAEFTTCPSKNTIRELFDDWDDLRQIEQREGFPRCYEKVKNIMKKRRAKDR